jgi:hypothetical protein
MKAHSVKRQDDDGVALVLALIFITIVALFAATALAKSEATSKGGVQVRDRGSVQYALDGGVEFGLNRLTQELRNPPPGGPTLCATAGSVSSLGNITLNGHTVDVRCTTYGGTSRDATAIISNFALVVRSTASNAIQTYGPGGGTPTDCSAPPNKYFKIGGGVYLSGLQSNTLDPSLFICGGDVVEQSSPGCPANVAALTSMPIGTPGHVRDCTDQTPAEATPTVSLPPRPAVDPDVSNCYSDTDNAGAVSYFGCAGDPNTGGVKCRVFYPGHYTSPPATLGGKGNYFTSGDYYFDNIGLWTVNDDIVAGRRVVTSDLGATVGDIGCDKVTESTLGTSNAPVIPTTTTSLASRIDAGGGSRWILDGASNPSALNVKAILTLNSRPHTLLDPPSTLIYGGYSQWAIPSGVSMPGAVSTSCTPYYGLCNSNASENLTVNGRLNAPTAPVNLFASHSTDNAITGGAAVFDIRLGASVPGSAATDIEAPGGSSVQPPPYRTVRIDATTTGTSSTDVAVATISNFGTHAARVKSWRTG